MGLLALCYPKLAADDQRFIDEFRCHHDHAYRDVVRPHFTMVFEVRELAETVFSEHVPHVGIATLKDPRKCKELADELNARGLRVGGRVDKISVVEYDGKVVTDLRHFRLGNDAS